MNGWSAYRQMRAPGAQARFWRRKRAFGKYTRVGSRARVAEEGRWTAKARERGARTGRQGRGASTHAVGAWADGGVGDQVRVFGERGGGAIS